MWGTMLDFILGAFVGALTAWLSFFIAVYPYYKRQATENALLRNAVDSWEREAQYLQGRLQNYELWQGGNE